MGDVSAFYGGGQKHRVEDLEPGQGDEAGRVIVGYISVA